MTQSKADICRIVISEPLQWCNDDLLDHHIDTSDELMRDSFYLEVLNKHYSNDYRL